MLGVFSLVSQAFPCNLYVQSGLYCVALQLPSSCVYSQTGRLPASVLNMCTLGMTGSDSVHCCSPEVLRISTCMLISVVCIFIVILFCNYQRGVFVSRTCVPHLVMEASLSCNALLARCLFISTAGFCVLKNVEMCYHHGGCSITLSIHVPAVRSMKCSLALMFVGSAFFLLFNNI